MLLFQTKRNLGSTDYMQRRMALVKQAQEKYQRRLAEQPPAAKLVPSEYMLRQIALVEQAQAERAARIQQEAAKQNKDQECARLGKKR